MNARVVAFLKAIFLFTLMMFIVAPSVGAVLYDWSYVDPDLGGVLSGRIEGTPTAADPALVSVTSLSDLAFESISLGFPKLDFTSSVDDLVFGSSGTEPIVSLDGMFMDLFASDAPLANYVAFSFENLLAANGLAGVFINGVIPDGSTVSFSSTSPWDPEAWTMRTAPVPEPATMLLLGSGLVALAGFRRKGRKA